MKMPRLLHPSDIRHCARILAPILAASEHPQTVLAQIMEATAREMNVNKRLASRHLDRRQNAGDVPLNGRALAGPQI